MHFMLEEKDQVQPDETKGEEHPPVSETDSNAATTGEEASSKGEQVSTEKKQDSEVETVSET